MTSGLVDRHCVVTGASGGLGGAVVRLLTEQGAICHAPCYEAEAPTIEHSGPADRLVVTTSVDLTDEQQVERYFATLPSLWASIHLIGGFAMSPVSDTSLQEFRRMFTLNVDTAFLSCREAVRHMNGPGRIVNIAARPALTPVGGMVAYSSAKAAVASLTECLAQEVKARGILVNAIVPSIIDTPANREAMPEADYALWPTPSQLAQTIGFLVSPFNELTTGAVVPAYGQS